MTIQAIEVKRDPCGMWSHPDMPEFDESTTRLEIEAWLSEHKLDLEVVFFEETATEEMQTKWFDDGDCDCSKWVPAAAQPAAFLLSIHDTEDYGPIALYAFAK